MSGTTIELGIEDNFVSQLYRAQLVGDTRSDQAHDTTRSQDKGDAIASQPAYVGTVMIETLQSQENDIQRTKERKKSHVEDNTIYHPLSTIRYSKLCIQPFYHYRGLCKLGSQIIKGCQPMEECLPYKQEVGGSIPPCPNDIIISVKNNKFIHQKIRDK